MKNYVPKSLRKFEHSCCHVRVEGACVWLRAGSWAADMDVLGAFATGRSSHGIRKGG